MKVTGKSIFLSTNVVTIVEFAPKTWAKSDPLFPTWICSRNKTSSTSAWFRFPRSGHIGRVWLWKLEVCRKERHIWLWHVTTWLHSNQLSGEWLTYSQAYTMYICISHYNPLPIWFRPIFQGPGSSRVHSTTSRASPRQCWTSRKMLWASWRCCSQSWKEASTKDFNGKASGIRPSNALQLG